MPIRTERHIARAPGLHLHWHRFPSPGLPVRFPALPRPAFRWAGIYGVQIGPWLVGVVKGEAEPPASATEARRDEPLGSACEGAVAGGQTLGSDAATMG